MILINQERLIVSDALRKEDDKLHAFAKVYTSALAELKKRFGTTVHFIRPDRPRHVKGATSVAGRIREMPSMTVPVEAMSIPLTSTVVIDGIPGSNTWTCSLGAPKPIAGNLWEPGGQKSLILKSADLSINIDEQPDLAFYLFKISKLVKKGILKIKDAEEEANLIAEKEHLITERKMAVWKNLPSDKVAMLARAYGLNKVDDKSEAILRAELEAQLEKNDELKKRNPAIKGTVEFIEEMKVTDSVILRAFVRKMLDEKRLTLAFDKFKIGDKVVYHVPAKEIKRSHDALCQYLNAGNNEEKLKEFVRDLLYVEHVAVADRKELEWFAKVAGITSAFKTKEDLQKLVTDFFCPVY